MDLWRTLGISPATGLVVAGAALVAAAVLAVRMFRKAREPRFTGVDLGDARRG
jgi:hypothetical protein